METIELPQMPMDHDQVDPRATIMEKIGSLSELLIFGNHVLLGVYERPAKTKSGIYLSDQTRSEDKYQGKAGLVLKKGRTAFVSDHNYDFGNDTVKVGDWVAIFISDGRPVVINGQLCRIVEDQYIRLKIPAPDIIF